MRRRINLNSGFTLVEMIAVLALFAVFATVVTFRQDSFRDKISVEQTAANISLFIQETQSVSTGASNLGGSERRGVYFSPGLGSAGTLYSFSDSESGTVGIYDIEDEILEELNLPEEVSFTQACLQENGSDAWDCDSAASVNIVFTRGDITPNIQSNGMTYGAARIQLDDRPENSQRHVVINQNGVVYVQ